MPFTDVWDVTQPPDTQPANLLGQDLRSLKLDIQQRIGAMSGTFAARPNLGTDAQPTNWTGFLYWATDTKQLFQWGGLTWTLVDVSKLLLDTTSPVRVAPTTAVNINSVNIPGALLVTGAIVDITGLVTCTVADAANDIGLYFGVTLLCSRANVVTGSVMYTATVAVTGAATQIGVGKTGLVAVSDTVRSAPTEAIAGIITIKLAPVTNSTGTFQGGLLAARIQY